MKPWMFGALLVACGGEEPAAKPAPEPAMKEIAISPMPKVHDPEPDAATADEPLLGGVLGTDVDVHGGLGLGGDLGSGGGTGWGTIGTGRYGTFTGDHGGVGTGGRAAPIPFLTIGQPTCVGELDKAIIRRYLKRHALKLSYCYEKELLAKPGLAGTVATHFIIGEDGAVATAQATGVDPAVASCVAEVLRGIEFPKPRNAGVTCSYPLIYRPTGGRASPP